MTGSPTPNRLPLAPRTAGIWLCLSAMMISAGPRAAWAQDLDREAPAELVEGDPPRITVSRAGDALGAPIELVSRSVAQSSILGGSANIPRTLPLAAARLTSRFGMRFDPVVGGHRMHSGVDLAAAEGTPVTSPEDGTVSFSNWSGGYGMLVSVEHASDVQTRFAHLSRLMVRPGQHVRKGQLLGLVGSTGRSTGPHLHYEVRHRGRAIDPLAMR